MVGFWQAMKMAAIMRHAALVYAVHGHDPRHVELEMQRHLRFVDDVYEGIWALWGQPLYSWCGRT